jgi:hypothetical protein
MNSAADYRMQAAACRRAANLSRGQHPTPYLITLAKDYERRAALLEARFSDAEPAAFEMRETK